MYNRYALLAILLIQTLGASVVGARGSAITGRASLRADTTYPCTVVPQLPITSTICSTGRVTTANQRSVEKPLLHFLISCFSIL